MLKLSDLAQQSDLRLGPLFISPSRRRIEGPAGVASVEPLIMQVFLLLLRARGKVVTRTELFDQVWGGVMVGDASLNRAIARVRRIAAETAPGLFEIETIPRTGYRLIGDIALLQQQVEAIDAARPHPQLGVSRRALAVGGAAVLAASGAGYWWHQRDKTDPRVATLMKQGREKLIDGGGPATSKQAVDLLGKAVALDSGNARAWGLLAYAQSRASEMGPVVGIAGAARAAEQSARTALSIDPAEPHALLAMLQFQTIDWISREEECRRILAIAPDNVFAMRGLSIFMHSVGRCRESYAMGERALAIEPLWPDLQMRRAMRLWVLGRVPEADRAINRAMDHWPADRLVRNARLLIYAFTGRTNAALAIVDEEENLPILFTPEVAAVWRTSLLALEKGTPSTIASALEATVKGARTASPIAASGILILSELGELDAAFEVANGFLLDRGSIIVTPERAMSNLMLTGWRNTFGLFTPPTAAMRLDARFRPLADQLGLTEYWRKRGVGPDAFLFKA